jgi:hypothetical protein
VINRYVGNLAPMPGVFPDYKAPIVRNGPGGRELATARWGMPSSSKALMDATKKRAEKLQAKGKPVDFKELLRMEPDGGTTNIRNVKSKHWSVIAEISSSRSDFLLLHGKQAFAINAQLLSSEPFGTKRLSTTCSSVKGFSSGRFANQNRLCPG